MTTRLASDNKTWWGLFALALLAALCFQGSRGVWEPDEGFYTVAAGEMARSGDYVVPRVNGGVFLEKPPVVYWMMASGLKLFGWNEWGLRFFHALCLALTALLVALLGSLWWGREVGLRAGLFYLLALAPFAASNILTPDMPLTFLVTAGMYCFYRGWRDDSGAWKTLFLACFAAAWMTKSTASLVWLSGPVMFLLLTGNTGKFLKGVWWLAALPIAAAALAWYGVAEMRAPGALAYLWKDHVTGRLVLDFYQRNPGWRYAWFYIPVLLLGALPFSLFWPRWFAAAWRGPRGILAGLRVGSPAAFLWCWVLFPMAVLTLAQSRLVLYAVPVFGALVLAAARLWETRSPWASRALWAWAFLLLFLKAGAAWFPYAQDDRAVWRSLKDQCPPGKGAVVLTHGGLNGIGFYADKPVRNVLWGDRYLYFDPPPPWDRFAAESKREEDWTIWVTDARYAADLAAQLRPYGSVEAARRLPGGHASVLLRFRP